jgi:bifunctional non-homologous end joining protein LigD
MSLREYKAKRNFRSTREPVGKSLPQATTTKNFFVVQKHAATRLHYDFRLGMEGVLKSWAVPKGFPTKKGDRRLAVQVEDHPLDYAHFEGTIPEGNYGAGTVMVWDTGSYEVGGGNPPKALAKGKLHLTLRGKKLKGEWTLVRMRNRETDDKPQWLLLKSGEDVPDIDARADRKRQRCAMAKQPKRYHAAKIPASTPTEGASGSGSETKPLTTETQCPAATLAFSQASIRGADESVAFRDPAER